MEFRESIQDYTGQPISKQIILDLLKGYKRPYDKINELIKQGILTLVKRGIYVPGPNLNIAGPEPFLLANHIFGPSYVSLDTALSYWGLIPEKVYEISSVTVNKSKTYKTPAGRFSYTRLPLPYYVFGIQRIQLTKTQIVLIASPEKALCDKIITTPGILLRSAKQVKDLLLDDLRIEKEMLRNLNTNEMSKWINDAPKKESFRILIKTLIEI